MNLRHRGACFVLVLVAVAAVSGANAALAAATPAVASAPSAGAQQAWTPITDRADLLRDITMRPDRSRAPQFSTLTIRTSPALPGVRLSMDGTAVVTDDYGVATITQARNSQLHALTLLDPDMESGNVRHTFARWVGQRNPDQAFSPTLDDLPMRGDDTLTVAFTTQHAVTARFVDQDGQVIDPGQVSSATARSDTGAVIPIASSGPTWVESTRVVYHSNTLEMQDASYSWQSVVVSGTNVVDVGRQSFTPSSTPVVTVVGQYYDLTVSGYDAMLGHGAGDEVLVTFPDGEVRTAPLNGDHSATFGHLPRGTYQVTVNAGSSIVGSHQVRLSRSTTLNVPIISAADIAIVAGSVISLAIGLVLVGRKNIRRRVTAPFRAATPLAETIGAR